MECGIAKHDLGRFSAAVVEMAVVFPGEAHPAVDLDGPARYLTGRVAGVHLGDRDGGGRARFAAVEHPGRVERGGARTFGPDVHVGALVLHGLVSANWFAELLARLRVLDGDLHASLHPAGELRRKADRRDLESLVESLAGSVTGSEHLARNVVE